jgi:hypothetical protein
MPVMLTLASYEQRVNKNGKPYLVVKDSDNISYLCQDPRIFAIITGSQVISAEISTQTDGNNVFRKIIAATSITAAPLPITERTSKEEAGTSGGYPLPRDISIVRQNVLNRGFDSAIALMGTGYFHSVEGGPSVARQMVELALQIAAEGEKWVFRTAHETDSVADVQTVAPPQPVAQPVATPAPEPVTMAAPETVDEFAGCPF